MIVLRENEWAEQMIKESKIGDSLNETLRRVARYYLDAGYDRGKTRAILDTFLLKCQPSVSLVKMSDRLDDAVSSAVRREAVYIESIPITVGEINRIKQLKSRQCERVAFVLLCLAKYWIAVKRENSGWVFNKDNEVMSLADVSASIKRQCAIYRQLAGAGMIQLSKRIDSFAVKVCFIEPGEVAMRVSTFKSLGYQYCRYLGERFDECETCGTLMKPSPSSYGRKRRFCDECGRRRVIESQNRAAARQKAKRLSRPAEYTVYMHEDPSGKRYVGMTTQELGKVWSEGLGHKSNTSLYDAITFYGWRNIKHYVLEKTIDPERARNVAAAYIHRYDTANSEHGYNRCVTRHSSTDYDDIIKSCHPISVSWNGYTIS